MKGNEKRIITLCIGLFLWVVYIFQSTLAGYGIYEVVSFQMWEVIGYIPYICRAISVIWLLSLFIAVIRKRKTHASDKWFLVILLVIILWQNHYINDMNEQRSMTVPVEVVSIDPYQNMLTVQTLEKKSTIILETPMLVYNIIEPGRQYTVTYEWDGVNSNKGKLRMIRLSELYSSNVVVFENDYVQLKQVEGLSYVFHENDPGNGEVSYSISIYNQDYLCGRFGVRNAPECGVPQGILWTIFCSELSSHGGVELTGYEVVDEIERYTLEISELPFSYGDTEWLVAAGVFKDTEEACQETRDSKVVLWSKEGVDKGYYFYLNTLFISDEQITELTESVVFKEGAFAPEKVPEWLAAEGGVASAQSNKANVFVPENATKLAYRIEHDGKLYHVPEHTVALQVDEDDWDLYGYTSTGTVKVGTIHVNDMFRISLNNGVVCR